MVLGDKKNAKSHATSTQIDKTRDKACHCILPFQPSSHDCTKKLGEKEYHYILLTSVCKSIYPSEWKVLMVMAYNSMRNRDMMRKADV